VGRRPAGAAVAEAKGKIAEVQQQSSDDQICAAMQWSWRRFAANFELPNENRGGRFIEADRYPAP
jgi:hypothetical protein